MAVPHEVGPKQTDLGQLAACSDGVLPQCPLMLSTAYHLGQSWRG